MELLWIALGIIIGMLVFGEGSKQKRQPRQGYQPKKGDKEPDFGNPPSGWGAATRHREKPTPSPREPNYGERKKRC